MKNGMKKVFAVLLALAMLILCLSACEGNGGNTPSGDALKIGGIGPLTGGAALYGKAVEYGAKLAVKEINDAGGINGMQIEFRMEDDEHDAEKAVNVYNALKGWGMQILVGTVTTLPCLAVISETKKDNMFEITPSASAAEVVQNDNCFQVCFSDPNQGRASADFIAERRLAQKVAVIYNNADPYSSGIYNAFKKEAQAKGLELVSETTFTDESKIDFSTQLGDIKESGAEIIFIPFYAEVAQTVLKQADEMGIKAPFFGVDGLDGILAIPGFEARLAEGAYLLTPFAANAADETTKKFVAAYRAAGYPEEYLIQFAADGYDAIYIIKAAAEKAGITKDMSVSEIGDKMIPVMPQISIDGVTGRGMEWAASGEINKEPKAIKIVNGEYQPTE